MRKYVLILCSLAACLLSGCSESDYGSDSGIGNTSSGSMSIGVSLPSSTTRVTETADAAKGLVTTWENTDTLQIFHKYTNNVTAGTMQGFKFASTGAGSATTFACRSRGVFFTSSSPLYAFNALPTASNYTQTYSPSCDNFTLSLSGYDSQDGTLANLRNYDAMYGVSSVGDNGIPATMGMKHLTSVLRFDFSSMFFGSTLTSVNFSYTASSGSSLLPASAISTLTSNGVLFDSYGGQTGVSSWTVTGVDASSGTASVYLMTFADQRSGTLTITATDSYGIHYYRKITLNKVLFFRGDIKAYKVTLNLMPVITCFFNYYQWDATAENPTPYSESLSAAVNSCKNCPTYDQIQMYIGAGAYWDSSTKWKKWKDTSGTLYTGGIWFKKKAYISGFDAGTATKSTSAVPTPGVPTDTSEYFFMPASGFYIGSASIVGSFGAYWSSTPSDTSHAYYLYFNSSSVDVSGGSRGNGLFVWSMLE